MIKLNKIDGKIKVDETYFDANTAFMEVEDFGKKYTIETDSSNSKSALIPNVDNGDSTLLFTFHAGKLKWVKIFVSRNHNFPPFTITELEKEIVRKRLIEMGGAKRYPWGSIQYSEDNKGGSVGILITYDG